MSPAVKRGPRINALSMRNGGLLRARRRHDVSQSGAAAGLCPVRRGDAAALRTQCAVPDPVSAPSAVLVASRRLWHVVLSHGGGPAGLRAVSLRAPQERI